MPIASRLPLWSRDLDVRYENFVDAGGFLPGEDIPKLLNALGVRQKEIMVDAVLV